MKRYTWKAWLAALLILLSGIAIGVSLTLHFGSNLIRNMVLAHEGGPAPLDNGLLHLEASWAAAVHLTPEQRRQVHEELQKSKPALQHFKVETVQRLQLLLGDMVQRCEQSLDEKQREELHRHVKSRLDFFGLELTPSVNPADSGSRSPAPPAARSSRDVRPPAE